MPAAYLLAQVDVFEPKAFEAYRLNTPGIVKQYGGEYIVRTTAFERLEGDEPPPRVVVIRFPDKAAATAWYASPEYKALRALRNRCARTNMVLVEGVD